MRRAEFPYANGSNVTPAMRSWLHCTTPCFSWPPINNAFTLSRQAGDQLGSGNRPRRQCSNDDAVIGNAQSGTIVGPGAGARVIITKDPSDFRRELLSFARLKSAKYGGDP